jgi:hypothetical protein
MRFSEPRFRLPISATRFRHAGTPVSRRSSSVRGCRPCPRCPRRCLAAPKSEEPCRLPFFSAPSLAGDVPYLSVPGARPMVWLAGKRGELVASLQRAAWAGNPRAKDPHSDIGAPMNGIARVPLLLRFRAPYVVSPQDSERLEPLSVLAGADQDLRSTASPRRVTTFRRPGCLGRFVSTSKRRLLALLRPTDLEVTQDPEILCKAWRPAPF